MLIPICSKLSIILTETLSKSSSLDTEKVSEHVKGCEVCKKNINEAIEKIDVPFFLTPFMKNIIDFIQ